MEKSNLHEKIYKLEDGSRLKVAVSISVDCWSREPEYNFEVYAQKNGERKWKSVSDRNDRICQAMSFDERAIYQLNLYIEAATAERLNEVALELWESLKPKPVEFLPRDYSFASKTDGMGVYSRFGL